MKNILCALFAAALVSSAGAGTPSRWMEVSAVDPVSGETVVMHWPNRDYRGPRLDMYDEPGAAYLVTWPSTDDHDLWFNPKSGFGAFRLQFEELGLPFDRASLERVRTWLATNYDPANPPRTRLQKLAWVERIYAQRNMTPDFWSSFYGLMAYEYAAVDKNKSLAYVRKALPLLEASLDDQEGIARAHILYLLGEFNRQLG